MGILAGRQPRVACTRCFVDTERLDNEIERGVVVVQARKTALPIYSLVYSGEQRADELIVRAQDPPEVPWDDG